MHKITLLTVGKVKTAATSEICSHYLSRLQHFADIQNDIIPAGEKDEENERVMKYLERADGFIVVLNETGTQMSSQDFASWLSKKRDEGIPLTFVIGGAYGLSKDVLKKADMVLALSAMTFPHELAQLFFLEQLYRAHAIVQGSGYHH